MLAAIIQYIIEFIQENRVTYLVAFGVFLVVWIGSKRIIAKIKIRIQENPLQTEAYNVKIANLTGRILWTLSIILNILIMCEIVGLHTALLMWWISLSLGFAMENTIENMIAGIMLITGKKIQIGEFVEFLGKLNVRGTVEEITIRYTIIRCFDKRRIIIPNSIINTTPLRKMKSLPLVRGEINIKVPRDTPIETVRTLVKDHINAHKWVLEKVYTTVYISQFDSFGIGIKAIFFADPRKKKWPFIIARELKRSIHELLGQQGINVPFNHITLLAE